MPRMLKIIVYTPESHSDQIRIAMAEAGAGVIGDYGYCSFSVKGFTRFMPLKGSNPVKGEIGKLEIVEEERIETVCEKDKVVEVVKAIRNAHPYEEPAIDIFPIEVFE